MGQKKSTKSKPNVCATQKMVSYDKFGKVHCIEKKEQLHQDIAKKW